jgi:phosphohistidine phosphatase
MKRLSLIRHAKSDWGHEDLEDIDRPLNARGYADARAMAARIRSSGIQPDYIFSSTAVRAASTALIFARELEIPEDKMLFTARIYEVSPRKFIEALQTLPHSVRHPFVFGHNNTLTEVVNSLCRQNIPNIPTCGFVMMEAEIMCWEELKSCIALLFDYPKNI